MQTEDRELVVVGGGPAGLAAAIEARRAGAQVTLIDERPTLGGQIYKQPPLGFGVKRPELMGKEYLAGRALIDEAERSGAELLTDHVVWGVWDRGVKDVYVYQPGGSARLFKAGALVLATGAYDRPVPFPGWTLAGVMTAGGAQSVVKTQKVLPGRKMLIAGSGPLVLAFSVQLHQMGMEIAAVLEAASSPSTASSLGLLAAAAKGNWGLLAQGLGYLAYLRRHGIPLLYRHAIARAEGDTEVQGATGIRVGDDWRQVLGTQRSFDVDTVCVGYGFVPSTEIARSLDCRMGFDEQLGGHIPTRDENLESSVPGVYVAGDGSRVAGSAVAVEEGRIAGISAASKIGKMNVEEARRRASPARDRLASLHPFRRALETAYRVGPGIYEWATDDTIACRCEEITFGELRRNVQQGSRNPNSLKALTRAGMGMCQGRMCGRQVSYLFARETGRLPEIPLLSARPPVKPVPVGVIADTSMQMPSGIVQMPGEESEP